MTEIFVSKCLKLPILSLDYFYIFRCFANKISIFLKFLRPKLSYVDNTLLAEQTNVKTVLCSFETLLTSTH